MNFKLRAKIFINPTNFIVKVNLKWNEHEIVVILNPIQLMFHSFRKGLTN